MYNNNRRRRRRRRREIMIIITTATIRVRDDIILHYDVLATEVATASSGRPGDSHQANCTVVRRQRRRRRVINAFNIRKNRPRKSRRINHIVSSSTDEGCPQRRVGVSDRVLGNFTGSAIRKNIFNINHKLAREYGSENNFLHFYISAE